MTLQEDARQCWETPPGLAQELANRYAGGQFDLDVCASAGNTKASFFFTREDDGLTKDWFGRAFCNPPWKQAGKWAEKAIQEVEEGRAEVVVMLVIHSPCSRWRHKVKAHCLHEEEPIGRVAYLPPPGVKSKDAPMAPSTIYVFRKRLVAKDFYPKKEDLHV